MAQKFPQIYSANHATFPIRIRTLTVQIFGNFWVTLNHVGKYILNTFFFIIVFAKRNIYVVVDSAGFCIVLNDLKKNTRSPK